VDKNCHYILKTSLLSLLVIISNSPAATFEVGNGDAVIVNDAAAVYFNPAGLTSLTNPQLIAGDTIAITNIEFEGRTTNFTTNQTQVGSASSNTFIHMPTFFYAMPLNKTVSVGLGVLTPFYGIDEYTDTSILRYSGTGALLMSYDITPGIAFKLTNSDAASIGVGFDAQYLNSYENFMLPPLAGTTNDLRSLNSASNWGYGGHAGILLHPIPKTYLGLVYHSQVHVNATGESTLQWSPHQWGGKETKTDALKYQLSLPPSTVFSIYQLLTSKLSLLGTAEFTQWKTVQDIFLQNVMVDANETVSFHQLFNYHDTWRFNLASYYQIGVKWLLRGSLGYDSDPSDPKTLTANVPSMDVYVVAIGAQYVMTKAFTIGFGYSHSFYINNPINFVGLSNTQFGTLREKNDCVGVRLTWNFV
jgi:long-chain fatty acid transport protein